ncbi:MAG: NifB/NifX family molybdenum-iron cluster-binding protein [Planctomycetes bacterium]|nr:NifB/NifX family molybdenum-iron cluster-binding protein [Planctomycetota bacterium]
METERKIAIPTFATRVSPRFDCAQSALIVTIDGGKPSKREELEASDWAPHERVNRLLEQGVDTVICGSIDRWSAASLQSAGVTVYGWVTGEAEDALTAFLQGDLDSMAATKGPGRCGCQRFPGDVNGRGQSSGFGQGARRRGGRHAQRGGGHGGGGPAGPRDG